MCRAPNKQDEWNKLKQPDQNRLPQTINGKAIVYLSAQRKLSPE